MQLDCGNAQSVSREQEWKKILVNVCKPSLSWFLCDGRGDDDALVFVRGISGGNPKTSEGAPTRALTRTKFSHECHARCDKSDIVCMDTQARKRTKCSLPLSGTFLFSQETDALPYLNLFSQLVNWYSAKSFGGNQQHKQNNQQNSSD